MPRKSVPAAHDWALENAGDDLRPERDRAESELAIAERDRGYVAFVDYVEQLVGRPLTESVDIAYDYVDADGWRHIDYWLRGPDNGLDDFMSLWLAPGRAQIFPPDLDIPF